MEFFGFGPIHPHNWRSYIYGRSPTFYVLAILVIAGLIFGMSRWTNRASTVYPVSDREAAWAACAVRVAADHNQPVTGADDYTPASVTLLDGGRFQAALHYKAANVFYTCTLEKGADGSMNVIRLEKK